MSQPASGDLWLSHTHSLSTFGKDTIVKCGLQIKPYPQEKKI